MKVDISAKSKQDNNGSYFIQGTDQVLQINKKDLVFKRTNDHTHHYLPDFSDETETYVAITCALPGCIHGKLVKKDGKQFTDWLDQHRVKS